MSQDKMPSTDQLQGCPPTAGWPVTRSGTWAGSYCRCTQHIPQTLLQATTTFSSRYSISWMDNTSPLEMMLNKHYFFVSQATILLQGQYSTVAQTMRVSCGKWWQLHFWLDLCLCRLWIALFCCLEFAGITFFPNQHFSLFSIFHPSMRVFHVLGTG